MCGYEETFLINEILFLDRESLLDLQESGDICKTLG